MEASGLRVAGRGLAAGSSHLVAIARAELPDLDMPIGVFGSRSDCARVDADDDDHPELMSCLHPFLRDN
jgi:hypothetical protein